MGVTKIQNVEIEGLWSVLKKKEKMHKTYTSKEEGAREGTGDWCR